VLFHKPVLLGENKIETKFKKIGKRVINIEGNIFSADGELAATLIHSTSIIRSSEG
jgi:acyl-coenzyme A thioesterase PaaI-like protein